MTRDTAWTILSVTTLAATAVALALLPRHTLGVTTIDWVRHLPAFDKLEHAWAFGAIVAPAAFFRPKWLWWLIPATALLCAAIELMQPLVGRDMELADWLASMLGVAVASAVLVPAGLLSNPDAPPAT